MSSLPLPFEAGKTKRARQSILSQLGIAGARCPCWDSWDQKGGLNNGTRINKNLHGTSQKDISPGETSRGRSNGDGRLQCTDIIQELPTKQQACFWEGRRRIARTVLPKPAEHTAGVCEEAPETTAVGDVTAARLEECSIRSLNAHCLRTTLGTNKYPGTSTMDEGRTLRRYYFEHTDRDIKIHSRTKETFDKKLPDRYRAKCEEDKSDAPPEFTGGKQHRVKAGREVPPRSRGHGRENGQGGAWRRCGDK